MGLYLMSALYPLRMDPEGPLAYAFGVEENKLNVLHRVAPCCPYFSVALSSC